MLPFHTILHPTDFSQRSKNAFQVACALARDYSARLIVVHVKPPHHVGGEVYMMIKDPDVRRQELMTELEALKPADDDLPIERVLKEGSPAPEIVQTAKEMHCDVIVMGAHGHSALARLLMGSTTEAVLRISPCPVLMIRAPFPVEAVAASPPAAAPPAQP
jgi:nucleotide-binding universal stress UspA family protein